MVRNVLTVTIFIGALALLLAGCSASQSSPTPVPVIPSSAGSGAAPTDSVSSAISSDAPSAAGSSYGDTVNLVVVPGQSKAAYRVREQLARLSFPSDAVGTTTGITGTIVGKTDGTIVSSGSKFTVDLSTLKSDSGMRDNFLRRSVLDTAHYQYATFVPTDAPGLPTSLPASGQATFKLDGNLTIKDVTKPVTWDVTCQAQGNAPTQATCQATTSFTFEYFNLEQPSVATVLSIQDHIALEVDVVLQKSS